MHPVQIGFGLSHVALVLLSAWAWRSDQARYADALGVSVLLLAIWAASNVLYALFGFPPASAGYPVLDAVGALAVLGSGREGRWKGGVLACFVLMAGMHLTFWMQPGADPLTYWKLGNIALGLQLAFAALPGGGRVCGDLVPVLLRRLRRGPETVGDWR